MPAVAQHPIDLLSTDGIPAAGAPAAPTDVERIVLERKTFKQLMNSPAGAKLVVGSVISLGIGLLLFLASYYLCTPRRVSIRGRRLFAAGMLPPEGVEINRITTRRVRKRLYGMPVNLYVYLTCRDDNGRETLLALDSCCFPREQFDALLPALAAAA